ncbi:hypothetical protein KRX54_00455 [Actinomycetaceae bacterium TAE3-ERU4]|nr:hypothetical protein [Actinomycetaceae bacterium TAE3-ERU4]
MIRKESKRFFVIWGYHLRRQMRSVSSWILLFLVLFLAATQGIVTQNMSYILKSLADTQTAQFVESTLPEPSWEQVYLGWIRNLSQIISLTLIVVTSLRWYDLIKSGDVSFILSRGVRRSYYFLSAVFTTWLFVFVISSLGVGFVWTGAVFLFPNIPFVPVLLATFMWMIEIIFITAVQLLAVTLKPGVGVSLIVGLGLYIFLSVSSLWEAGSRYSFLGITSLTQKLASNTLESSWQWPVGTGIGAVILIIIFAAYRFNRIEL